MEKGATILLALVLIVPSVGAYRSKESLKRMESHEEAEENIMQFAETTDFCASARCNGYTDKKDSSEKQLKFRFPKEGLNVDPMDRTEVATEKGYEGYHHGSLKKCKPVTQMYSYSRDWAMHMQTNMREGIWPNQPGEDTHYSCAERCKLEIFNDEGDQLNKGSEPEVWVERDGHSGDVLSKIPFVGWSPATCMVGNALQAHWWKQKFDYTKKGKADLNLMVDPEGLPVFPFAPRDSPLFSPLREEFIKKFCALTKEQKISVTRRVTKYRPNLRSYGMYYGRAMMSLRARNYFPKGFPRKCDDGWEASTAEGVSKDERKN